MFKSLNPKGFGLVDEESNQRAYHPRGCRFKTHKVQTLQTLRPLKVCLVVNFRASGFSRGVHKLARTLIINKKKKMFKSLYFLCTLFSFIDKLSGPLIHQVHLTNQYVNLNYLLI